MNRASWMIGAACLAVAVVGCNKGAPVTMPAPTNVSESPATPPEGMTLVRLKVPNMV